MSAIDELPADQRAVLELVLARGRNYDQIAALLAIDRAGVRDRALAAMDGLAPGSAVPEQRRALIADYLLGQLPAKVGEEIRRRLEHDPADREWAQTLTAELSALASAPLPEVPLDGAASAPAQPQPPTPAPAAIAEPEATSVRTPSRRPTSRRGGAIVLGLGALVVIAAVVLAIVLSSGSSHHHHTAGRSAATTPPGTTTGAATTGTTPAFLDNSTLSPVDASSKAKGEAAAFSQSGALLLAIVAVNLPANTTTTGHRNFYGVWLVNSASDSRFLGFAPPVTKNGQLRAATQLKSTDGRYKKIVLTLETASVPKTPGTVILQGPFNLKSS